MGAPARAGAGVELGLRRRSVVLFDEAVIRALAGERSFERGERYYAGGRVSPLERAGEELRATVLGTRPYRVVLRPGDPLQWSCSCPMGRDGAFCKHCVATALAAVGADRASSEGDEIARSLAALDRPALEALVLEEAARDARLRERLRLRAAAAGADLAVLRRAIDDAIDPGDFLPYAEALAWAEDVEAAIEPLERLAETEPEGVIGLCEHALDALEDAVGAIDDSDGHSVPLATRIERLHLHACERARPDAEALAEQLLRRQLEAEIEPALDPLDDYAEVLGERGVTRYEELAAEEWAVVPPVGPGEDSGYGRNFRGRRVMEAIARRSGDPDRVVEVLCCDLSWPYSFLRIAEVLRDAGRYEEAIDWAERGLREFPDFQDHRLTDLLSEMHAAAGRHERTVELAWTHFEDRPGVETYAGLLRRAEAAGDPVGWRKRAHERLRERAEEQRAQARASGFRWQRARADRSQLVRILLWEGELDAAWQEACQGGCSEDLWLTLADRRAVDYPEDAVSAYRRLVPVAIERKTKRDYQDAVELIDRIGELLARLGRAKKFEEYVE